MPSLPAALALALAAAPAPAVPPTTAVDAHPATAPAAPRAPASRSAFGAAIAEMTRTLQADAAKRGTPESVDTAAVRTAAVDRDE